jgi:YVTN family beta-propeller protein
VVIAILYAVSTTSMAKADSVIATIPVGLSPSAVSFAPTNGDMYVANSGGNTVSVIDTSTNKVIATISVGKNPSGNGLAFADTNGDMYVANTLDDSVSVIDTSTNKVIATIPVGNTPEGVAFNPSNGRMYVTNGGGNTVSIISTISQDTTPPDTAIISAIDGSKRDITNGGSTLYRSIQIAFTGTDNVGIARFQCSFDGQAASSCTSPVTLNNLALGTHTFQVRAVDTSKNVDQTPAVFKWTIVTPSQYTQQLTRNLVNGITNGGSTSGSVTQFIQGIQQLVQFIQHTALPVNTAASLATPLNQAILMLTDNSPNNDAAACNTMNGFATQVNSYLSQRQISPIIAAQLIQQAQTIKTISHC